MSDPSQAQPTTSTSAPEPVLCNLGCGFFGNDSTGGMCSKCWREKQKSQEAKPTTSASNDVCKSVNISIDGSSVAKRAMEDTAVSEEKVAATAPVPEAADSSNPSNAGDTTTTKKKKKKSYKNMMASMMKDSGSKDKDKDANIRKVTGGGAFSKIEKI